MHKADNLPPSCAIVTKSGKLNFLEPSGPLRTCNGTALHLYMYIYGTFIYIYIYICHFGGHVVAQLVEASRYPKFAVSIPDGVSGIFN